MTADMQPNQTEASERVLWQEPVSSLRRRTLSRRAMGWMLVVMIPGLFMVYLVDGLAWHALTPSVLVWSALDWVGLVLASALAMGAGITLLYINSGFTGALITDGRICFGLNREFSRWFMPGPRDWPRVPVVEFKDVNSCEWHTWPVARPTKALPRMWTFIVHADRLGTIRLVPFFEPFSDPSVEEAFASLAATLDRRGVPTKIVHHPDVWSPS